jgi:hypothetical protein
MTLEEFRAALKSGQYASASNARRGAGKAFSKNEADKAKAMKLIDAQFGAAEAAPKVAKAPKAAKAPKSGSTKSDKAPAKRGPRAARKVDAAVAEIGPVPEVHRVEATIHFAITALQTLHTTGHANEMATPLRLLERGLKYLERALPVLEEKEVAAVLNEASSISLEEIEEEAAQ